MTLCRALDIDVSYAVAQNRLQIPAISPLSEAGQYAVPLLSLGSSKHPTWLTAFDSLPDATLASRRRLLDRAADEGALVLGFHLVPFPSLGHVRRQGEGWRWEPVEPARDLPTAETGAASGT